MGPWTANQQRALAALVVLILAGLCVGFVRQGRAVEGETVIPGRTPPDASAALAPPAAPPPAPAPAVEPPRQPATTQPPQEVVAHVAGAVAEPGVYRLPVGARAEDALRLAGGPLPGAALDRINLAGRLQDGQQLYVPYRQEGMPPAASAGQGVRSVPQGAPALSAKLVDPSQGAVDLNVASVDELQRLPGIGPAMAERIVAYRQTRGAFLTVDQLLDVPGIGPKKLDRLRPFVRVGRP